MSEQPETGLEEKVVDEEMASMFDLKKKKKTKTKKAKADEGTKAADENAEPSAAVSESGPSGDVPSTSSKAGALEPDPPSYSYAQLLNRVVDFVQQVSVVLLLNFSFAVLKCFSSVFMQNNPELTDKKRFTMKPPQLMRGEPPISLPNPFLCSPVFYGAVGDFSWYQEDAMG